MLDSRQLAALAAVVEEGGFDRAARRLHVTQSAVSQRIKQLEEQLGQTLVLRTSPIRATPAGQQVLKHFRQVDLLEQELLGALSLQDARGYTRVANRRQCGQSGNLVAGRPAAAADPGIPAGGSEGG